MAIRPDWEAGTITLVAGSSDFTTTDSALQTAAISAGDEIITPAGLVLIIAEITGQNTGQLMLPCPAGAAGANQPLRIRYQPDGSRVQGAMRMVREFLVTGNLDAFAALVGRPNAVPVFTGFGALALMDTDMFGGGSAGGWDATVFDRAGLDAYADRPAGYRVMVIDAGELRSAVFQKQTAAAGDWSQPIYFTGNEGKVGDKGEAGKDFDPQIGLLSERSAYDNQPVGFAFLATDVGAIYYRQGAVGEWSLPIPVGGGKPGADGLSAYQIAVQEGFAGTQSEWVASLKGSDASVTTANVGAAMAAASGEQSISDADSLAGVKNGTSSMRRWTWGIVKAWIKGWISKADVGLGNVSNIAPADMPVSLAQQSAFDGKFDKSGGQVAGNVNATGYIACVGDLATQASLWIGDTNVKAALDAKAGAYKGTDQAELNYPIGAPVVAWIADGSVILNSEIPLFKSSANANVFTNSGSVRISGDWKVLSKIWDQSSGNRPYLMQRVR